MVHQLFKKVISNKTTTNLKPSRLDDVYSEFKKVNPVLHVEVAKSALVWLKYASLLHERRTGWKEFKEMKSGYI